MNNNFDDIIRQVLQSPVQNVDVRKFPPIQPLTQDNGAEQAYPDYDGVEKPYLNGPLHWRVLPVPVFPPMIGPHNDANLGSAIVRG